MSDTTLTDAQGPGDTGLADDIAALKVPETKHAATDRELFFSLAPLARREALELLSVAEERRNYLAFLGATPVGAFQVLLSADFMLRNGSPDQKIAIILQLLKDYNIDIEGLQGGIKIGHVPARPVNRQ